MTPDQETANEHGKPQRPASQEATTEAMATQRADGKRDANLKANATARTVSSRVQQRLAAPIDDRGHCKRSSPGAIASDDAMHSNTHLYLNV
ncbi:hypothetical protein [Paraburkholderia sp. DHOC27]|uniref:hypothetical protein n=1 Tax=Paraburkholderia sp. DHOC27 TaxID=2303330 RepID=UPI0011C139E0|nr:hypothetical protein [Paraburkholderia sp. DHOC27]